MWAHLLITALLIAAPGVEPQEGPRKLSVTNAIAAALESNAEVQIAAEAEKQADANTRAQRSQLLPNVTGTAGYINQSLNLGARGFQFPGVPSKVGPLGTSDVRVQFNEPLLDLSLIRRYRAVKQAGSTSKLETESLRNRIAAMVATLYFNAQRAKSQVQAVEAQIDLDENLLKLARDRKDAGVGTGLDVTRAESRLAADRHDMIRAENDVRTAELRLLRAMGERPTLQIELTGDSLPAVQLAGSEDESIAQALRLRPELKAEDGKVDAARMNSSAVHAERFPAVRSLADYGNSGNRTSFLPTNTVGVQLSVPLFDGGLRSAHRAVAESQARQAETRRRDVRDEIEVDVRVAIDNVRSARRQSAAAQQALKLAQEELELATLRFESQVTTQIDVINAQSQLAEARSREVTAAFAVKAAEVEYLRATGKLLPLN